jgi:hypothetical protein
MIVRYVHDTRGEYVAFVANGHLFTPECQWLGVVQERAEVYNIEGAFIGHLQADDRLVRNVVSQLPKQILRPKPPLAPMRPLPPKRKLFMPTVSAPFEDVFLGTRRALTFLASLIRLQQLNELQGCTLVAEDGTFLGRISRDHSDPESLATATGEYGSPFAEHSIFNAAGRYGSSGSDFSPFHPTTRHPPRILREGEVLGYLSVNPQLPDRIHPGELISWLKLGGA